MKKATLFCLLALVVLIAVPAYAEVQNVKVSGDLSARWLLRWNYDLAPNKGVGSGYDFLMSTAEVQVDADLTDNVSTVVRLANQRDWGEPISQKIGTATDTYDVIVDLANVTFKEMVYSPLTVTIGRQDLWFGKGFIIGAKQRDPLASISANEYTVINSFDAIKATLDFDPWKIDGVYSLLEENTTNRNDHVWLLGTNIGYKFDSYNGEAEAYYWKKHDNSGVAYTGSSAIVADRTNWIDTYGIRGSFEPIANATLAAEGAMQFGRYSTASDISRSRHAGALDLSGDYAFKDMKWTPKLGLEYILYSGEASPSSSSEGTYHGWDMMYRGKFDSAIREFQNLYYATAQRQTGYEGITNAQDSGATNEMQFIIKANIKPTNNIGIDGRFIWFRNDKSQAAEAPDGGTLYNGRNKDLGQELDLTLNYTYTEDVSFGLLGAWFFPGKYWVSDFDQVATDVVGTVKVAF
ncbi:MAG: alginate export family protein [Candidatus Omnitrophica bacterium]|nr:alginate export family protein [Candidatus Omnitrophota bacterium]